MSVTPMTYIIMVFLNATYVLRMTTHGDSRVIPWSRQRVKCNTDALLQANDENDEDEDEDDDEDVDNVDVDVDDEDDDADETDVADEENVDDDDHVVDDDVDD